MIFSSFLSISDFQSQQLPWQSRYRLLQTNEELSSESLIPLNGCKGTTFFRKMQTFFRFYSSHPRIFPFSTANLESGIMKAGSIHFFSHFPSTVLTSCFTSAIDTWPSPVTSATRRS